MTKAVLNIAENFTRGELWLVVFIVLISMIWPSSQPVAVIGIALFWVARWIVYRRLSVRTPIDWPIVLIGIMILVTIFATALPSITAPQVFRLLIGIIFFYSVVNWTNTTQRLRLLMYGLIIICLLLSFVATISVQWPSDKLYFLPASLYSYFMILVSDPVHPNVMAGSLVILLPFALSWLLFDWGNIRLPLRIGLLSVVLLTVSIIILTVSRGAWIAAVTILGASVVLRWRWGWLWVSVAAIVGIAGIYLFAGSNPVVLFETNTALEGATGRIEVWSRAIHMIRDFFYTGIGMGSFEQVANAIYPFRISTPNSISHAHNLFLQIALDLGIPGLIAWVTILISVFVASWQVYRTGRKKENGWMAGLGAGLLCSQVALLTHGLVDAVTWGMVRTAPIVWGIWGLSIAAILVVKKEITP